MSAKQLLLFFINLFFISIVAFAHGDEHAKIVGGHIQHESLIKFTENKNQWDARVSYAAQLDGGMLFFEKNCFTYNFYDKETLRKNHVVSNKDQAKVKSAAIRSHAFRMTFIGADLSTQISSKNPTADYCNYFLGNDPAKWASEVKNYKEINYKGIYNDIDLQILGLDNSIKYNFYVAPFANPNDIKLYYEGVDKISLEKGEIKIKTSINEILEQKPYAYQDINNVRVTVPCEFVLKNNTISFNFPQGYNENYELVIDPVLVFACSSGSTADNFGMSATYDAAGNLYGGGTTFNVGYPVTVGAYDPTYNGIVASGRTDVVITKYNATGTTQIYSTYLGGALGTEIVSSLIVNAQNELIVFGATGSSDYPTTAGCYDNTFNGGTMVSFVSNGTDYPFGTDIYLTKFNATGGALIGSTYVGGSLNDGINNSPTLVYNYGDYYRGEVQIDAAGDIYVASSTYSNNFPTTAGVAQAAFGGGTMDAVLFKMNSTLTNLNWSTYVGGTSDDGGYALILSGNDLFMVGGTSSNNFPTTGGAISTAYGGGITDGYVVRVSSSGNAFLSSTFVGTGLYDQVFSVQEDRYGNIFILGQSLGNMPVTAGAYSNANSKQFIWKMNNTLTTRLVSTIFGNGNGQVNFCPSAFLVDNCDNIYVCGWGGHILQGTPTTGMPLTNNAIQSSTDGFNFYLMELDRDCKALKYATYFGGAQSQEHVDGGTSRFDKKGIVYQAVCSGCGGHDDFPVTPGAWPNSTNVNASFNCNMGDFKFDFQDIPVQAIANASPNDTICVGSTMQFTNGSVNALSYSWDFGDGSPVDTVTNPSHVYNTIGTYTVTVIAFDDSTACVVSDTFYLTVTVIPYPVIDLGNDTIICVNQTVTLNAGNPGCTYLWSTGATTQSITVGPNGNYWVTVTNGGICSVSDTINITPILQVKPFGNDTTLCIGNIVPIDALNNPGSTYLWSTTDTTQTITVNTSGTYWVQINTGPCTLYDTMVVTFVNYPVVNLPPDTTFCGTPNLLLDAGNPGSTYLWSTNANTQTITANATGTYFVEVANGSCKRSDTIVINNIVLVKPFGRDTTLCDGGAVTLNALNATPTAYTWSTGATSQTISVTTSGTYWVSIDSLHCNLRDTIIISFVPFPVVVLTKDTVVCGNPNLVLDPGPVANSYLWSTGATSQSINILDGGIYYVTATNSLNGVSCSRADTTVVTEIPPVELGHYYSFCNVDYISLDAGTSNASYLWSTGATTQTIEVTTGGEYWVNVTKDGCLMTDTVTIDGEVGDGALYFPNTFTPNNDLLNDKFNGKGADIIQYKLMIFNRWGELIYDTNTLDGGWDGKYKGTVVKNDVYVYKVNYKTKCDTSMQTRIGHVTVYR